MIRMPQLLDQPQEAMMTQVGWFSKVPSWTCFSADRIRTSALKAFHFFILPKPL